MNTFDPRPRSLLSPIAIAASVTLIVLARASADPLPPAMQAVLDAHNAYRVKHCVLAVTWSTALAASAQQWANRCQFDHDDQSQHGENLFWGTAGAFSPRSAVTAWYEEIGEHDFSKPELGDQAGHFTQVVWRSTNQIGCGIEASATFRSAAIHRPAMLAGSTLAMYPNLAADAAHIAWIAANSTR